VRDLNLVFRAQANRRHSADQWRGPDDQCETDPSILGTLVHGKTSAETNGAGQLQHAEVCLPVKLSINTPKGVRDADTGYAEVIAAHEFVHALGHAPHNSRLMAQTFSKSL